MIKTKRKGGIRKGQGRKGFAQENLARELVSLGAEICIKALKKEGEYSDLPMEVRVDLAARFAVKAIPTVFEGELSKTIIQIVRFSDAGADNEIHGSATQRTAQIPAGV